MIITEISATDILKYEKLEIQQIPEDGIIAIEGDNESGKSSIGEAICFALYGRSFSLEKFELEKLIRWGEPGCSVRLRFHNGNDKQYEITRFYDRDGNHGVRLCIIGQEEDPIARGVESVESALVNILGYGYEEFIESFYLAQREITTPHPHSYALKSMAGISLLEQASNEFKDEIKLEHEVIADIQEKADENEREQEALGIDEGLLGSLEVEKQAAVAKKEAWQADRSVLEAVSNDYQENIPQLHINKKRRNRAHLFLYISLIMIFLLGVGWWLLTRMPELQLTKSLQALLANVLPQWGEQSLAWLIYGVEAFFILALIFWGRSALLYKRMNKLKEVSPMLADRLIQIHGRQANVNEETALVADPPVDEEVAPADDAGAKEPIDDSSSQIDAIDEIEKTPAISSAVEWQRPVDDEVYRLHDRIITSEADPAEVRDLVGRDLAWIDEEMQRQQANIVRLDQAIVEENERLKKKAHYEQLREGYEQEIVDHEYRIHLRNIAIELLNGTSRHISHTFNRDVRELVGRTLPMFTEGRYEHLQIDDELNVRAFSNEKRDFMELEEISSGTQRQIMLAVRLALSQKLVNGMIKGKQFIFLDEPFAFFDQDRTRSTLKVLPKLSQEITQVWVVAQSFPDGFEFDRLVKCTIGESALQAMIGDNE